VKEEKEEGDAKGGKTTGRGPLGKQREENNGGKTTGTRTFSASCDASGGNVVSHEKAHSQFTQIVPFKFLQLRRRFPRRHFLRMADSWESGWTVRRG